jgi:tRNA(Arg) A34 adenosine deaminase TadA
LFTKAKLWQLVIIIVKEGRFAIQNIVFYVPNRYAIHAEQDCINKFLKRYGNQKHIFKECTLFLIKMNQQNELIKCEPCSMCQGIINKYGIDRVTVFYEKDIVDKKILLTNR